MKIPRKLFNILVAIDELGGTIIACLPYPLTWPGVGHPQETISESLGELKLEHNGSIPWKWFFAKGIEKFLDIIDKDHCIDAIDDIDEK